LARKNIFLNVNFYGFTDDKVGSGGGLSELLLDVLCLEGEETDEGVEA